MKNPPKDLKVLLDRLAARADTDRSEEHTSELQSHSDLVCRLLLEKKKKIKLCVTDTYVNAATTLARQQTFSNETT